MLVQPHAFSTIVHYGETELSCIACHPNDVALRYNEVKPTRLMTADEVHLALTKKAHEQWLDLAKVSKLHCLPLLSL